jgi:hypothetical protein
MDLVVEESVVVEIESVDALSPVHRAQLLSYLKLSGKSIGLLINFNVVDLKDGIRQLRKPYRMAAARKTKASTTKDTEVHKGFRTRFSFVYLRVLCG